MDSYFGMATVCPQGYSPNKKYKRGPGARQCLKDKKEKKTLSQLQAAALANQVSIYKRRKDNNGFTRTPLSIKALKSRLTRMKVAYFGMATVCRPGFSPDPTWVPARGRKECLKTDGAAHKRALAEYARATGGAVPAMAAAVPPLGGAALPNLSQLQVIAGRVGVPIYKRDSRGGFTTTPLSERALKAALTRSGIDWRTFSLAAAEQAVNAAAQGVRPSQVTGVPVNIMAPENRPLRSNLMADQGGFTVPVRPSQVTGVPARMAAGPPDFAPVTFSNRPLISNLMADQGGYLFGMATVCPPGKSPNRKYKRGRGARQCLKDKPAKKTLAELQALASANQISVYKRRKDDKGFTRTPLSIKALKLRLTRMRINYR